MNAKKLLFFALGIFLFTNLMAFEHGSMKENGLPMYPIRDGAAPGTAVSGVTFDFKLVTIGTKTWVWTDWHGKTIAGNTWSSQYRYWPGKIEKNLTGRIAGTQQTYGTVTDLPSVNPSTITFLQEEANTFFETDDMVYDYTVQNSKDDADNEAPVLNEPVANQSALTLELALSATDNSGDFFYYIVDEVNNFTEVSFFDNVKLTLAPETGYNFSVYAVDFSGNMSDVKVVTTEQAQPVYVTEGVARDISFKLDSRSLTELIVECTSNEFIGDAFVKLEINGNAIDKEWKPTIDQAVGTKTYQIIIPSAEVPGWGENAILGLNLGYIIMPIGNWGHYVLDNKTITSGENAGLPILHKIGTGAEVNVLELACDNNLLENTALALGEVYFATGEGWAPSENYTVSYENNELNITLGDGTWFQWQAQFPLELAAPLQMTPGEKYGISIDIETNNNLPVYVKFMDNNDDMFLEIARNTVAAPGGIVGAYNLVCPGGLTQISRILFDFGGNPESTILKIKNITVCDIIKEVGAGLRDVKSDNITISQSKDMITINSEHQIELVNLYSISGQLIPVALDGNIIRTSSLSDNFYILQVIDVAGNHQSFKVIVR